MKMEDLAGADWHKIDYYPLDQLVDQSKPFQPYSGSTAGWVQMMVEKRMFTDQKVPIIFRIHDTALWPKSGVPGISLLSRSQNIWTAFATFEGILALAKDKNIGSVDGSRPVGIQE